MQLQNCHDMYNIEFSTYDKKNHNVLNKTAELILGIFR
jgi:hypothetical protein